jgi:hypothetical protein
VDEMIHFGEDELADAPHLRPMRQRLAEIALAYYEELIELRRDDLGAQADLAVTRNKVEQVLEDIAALQGAGQIFMLAEPGVLADLKLTPEERSSVAGLQARAHARAHTTCHQISRLSAADRRERFIRLARENEHDITATLAPARVQRLRQIALQRQGLSAFREPDVVAALQLTPAQRERIRAIEFETGFAPPGPPRFGAPGSPRPADKTGKTPVRRAEGVLTAEQMVVWKELVGEPFTAPRPGSGPPRPR